MIKILTISLLIAIFFVSIIPFVVFNLKECKPHCDGILCGENSSDKCGGTCNCKEGGICKNGRCCYPNCDSLSCGSDGCGGTCENECKKVPNGKCIANPNCVEGGTCPEGKCFTSNGTCEESSRCCYRQKCENGFCGSDGCGGMCSCPTGSTCSLATGAGICVNNGTSGWKYFLKSGEKESKNVNSPLECASWIPKNIIYNIKNFPCKTEADCPSGQKCIEDDNGNYFCERKNLYQYWHYDPDDTIEGGNCTKILAGSDVYGIQKTGASGFDIFLNQGPDVIKNNRECTILPLQCNDTLCCPSGSVLNKDNHCVNNQGVIVCTNETECASLPKKGNMAEITRDCDTNVTTQVSVPDKQFISQGDFDFLSPCVGQETFSQCTTASFTGMCKNTYDGKLACLPESVCIPITQYDMRNTRNQAGAGVCITNNIF